MPESAVFVISLGDPKEVVSAGTQANVAWSDKIWMLKQTFKLERVHLHYDVIAVVTSRDLLAIFAMAQ